MNPLTALSLTASAVLIVAAVIARLLNSKSLQQAIWIVWAINMVFTIACTLFFSFK